MKYFLLTILSLAIFLMPTLAWADTKTNTTIGDSSTGRCFDGAVLKNTLEPTAGFLDTDVKISIDFKLKADVPEECLIVNRTPRFYKFIL